MKKETKSACKHLCIDCQSHYNSTGAYDGEDLCKAHKAMKTTSCINGETHTSDVRCIDHNNDGQCKLFDPVPNLKMRKALNEYIVDNPRDCFCRSTIKLIIAEDLLRVIEGESSRYFEMVYDSDDPYSGGVVVTKRAIEESINRRGYNITASERSYGCYIESRTSEERRKERSWLARVKNWLAFTE